MRYTMRSVKLQISIASEIGSGWAHVIMEVLCPHGSKPCTEEGKTTILFRYTSPKEMHNAEICVQLNQKLTLKLTLKLLT